jgi:histidine triad (HIT) family protein
VTCVFCGIIAGDQPASFVYSDGGVVAFLDVRPVTPGHLLVVPRVHAELLADLPEATAPELFGAALRLQRALRGSGLRCDGVNLFLADGEAAGQEVAHVHLHVVPRFPGDGFRIDGDWSRSPSRAELDAQAAAIRGA